MRIFISGPYQGVSLAEANDFKRFSVVIDQRLREHGPQVIDRVAARLEDSHAWISPSTIRSLTPLASSEKWESDFSAMVQFADQHGWTDPQGNIRAHIEYVDAEEGVDGLRFKQAMRKFASGVCVVATGAQSERTAMTVSSFTSVSVSPPLVSVCINQSAFSHTALMSNDTYSINILQKDQLGVAMTFAGATDLVGEQRFNCGDWGEEAGVPILRDAIQSLICRVELRQALGTHTLLLGKVISTSEATSASPLINFDASMDWALEQD